MADEQIKPKKSRHRKKQLYENIMKQMEFYFSDANLSKDRLIGTLIKEDPFVPIEIFLKFNKIRALTQDVKDIAKALKHSTFLECSEDGTKLKRTTPLKPYNADERTVYVESVPMTASMSWLRKIFEQYGPVAYVSLPKFPNSQKIKGFAFIEFKTSEDAQKCISAFTKMGGKLPTTTSPEELSTVKSAMGSTNIAGSQKPQKDKENRDTDDSEPPKKKQKLKKACKKAEKSLDGSDKDSSAVSFESNADSEQSESEQQAKKDRKKTDNDSQSENEKAESVSENEKSGEGRIKKKVRKRSKKERKEKSNAQNIEMTKGPMYGLQVLSKAEWKVLRNKYLNLQRKQMGKLKQTLRSNHTPMYKEPIVQKAEQVNEVPANECGIVRQEGVLVHVDLPEMCLDVRKLKREVRTNVHVQHVDVKEGQSNMVVRFDAPDSAQQFCSSGIYNSSRVLSGTEASECWCRAESEWARRRRGRDKLKQRIAAAAAPRNTPAATPAATPHATTPATHIRFDD